MRGNAVLNMLHAITSALQQARGWERVQTVQRDILEDTCHGQTMGLSHIDGARSPSWTVGAKERDGSSAG